VGSFSGIGYRTFLVAEAPVAVAGLACVFGVIWLAYRDQLPAFLAPAGPDARLPLHLPLMRTTGVVVLVMLGAFLAGVPVALVAIAGAAYTLLTQSVKPEKVYREINWGLLVLFAGLFVVIGAVEDSGLAADMLGWAQRLNFHRPVVLTAATAVLSNLVSNVPAVLLLKSVIPTLGDPPRDWLLVAMASTLAGNLTVLGSVANLIVVEAAREARIEIGFVEYARVGVPLTVLTLALGWLLLAFR
jgi:Na+/H+ antiporter NhaD/arsenite permease-like protein